MLVRIGTPSYVADRQMRVFDVAGTNVNVSNAGGKLYAFDDTCTQMGCSLANGELDGLGTTACACHGSQQSVHHPLTDRGILQFRKDWEQAQAAGQGEAPVPVEARGG